MPSSTVQTKMAHGAIWMVLFKIIERTIGLISTLILVRLLLPADFGIVAMALSFIVMAELLTAFGFDIALIHKQDAAEDHYHTAWTLHILMGLSITLLMLATAVPIADFYSEPDVFWVVCALAFVPLIKGAQNIGIVAFRKELDFRKEFWFQLSRKLVAFSVTVPLALLLESYWALVAGTLASGLFGTAYSYFVHPFRPRFCTKEIRSLMNFSKWLLLNNVVGFLKERMSDFFIGRMHGAASLGLYKISYEFAHLPSTELSAPINRALLPGFAKMADDAPALAAAYANAIQVLALLTIPAAAGIYAIAPYMVPVVLGDKWLEATPLLEVLTANGALLLFHSNMCTLLISIGHPRLVAKLNAIYVLVLLASLAALISYGALGAAYATLLTTVLATPMYIYQIRAKVGLGFLSFFAASFRPVVASALMIMVVRYILPTYNQSMTTLEASAWLIAGILLGAVTYIVMILIQWLVSGRPQAAETMVLHKAVDLLKSRFKK